MYGAKLPSPVYITEPILDEGERGLAALATLFVFGIRALIVWAFFATFFPVLGITYVLALCAIIAVEQLLPNVEGRRRMLATIVRKR